MVGGRRLKALSVSRRTKPYSSGLPPDGHISNPLAIRLENFGTYRRTIKYPYNSQPDPAAASRDNVEFVVGAAENTGHLTSFPGLRYLFRTPTRTLTKSAVGYSNCSAKRPIGIKSRRGIGPNALQVDLLRWRLNAGSGHGTTGGWRGASLRLSRRRRSRPVRHLGPERIWRLRRHAHWHREQAHGGNGQCGDRSHQRSNLFSAALLPGSSCFAPKAYHRFAPTRSALPSMPFSASAPRLNSAVLLPRAAAVNQRRRAVSKSGPATPKPRA